MITSASRLTVSRAHQLVSKSSAMYSTCLGIQKQMFMEGFEKSKIKNVRGCTSPGINVRPSEMNVLKNESVKAFAEFKFKPASKSMGDCAINTL